MNRQGMAVWDLLVIEGRLLLRLTSCVEPAETAQRATLCAAADISSGPGRRKRAQGSRGLQHDHVGRGVADRDVVFAVDLAHCARNGGAGGEPVQEFDPVAAIAR